MKYLPSDSVDESLIVKKTVNPSPVPEHLQERQERASYNWIVRLWHSIRGYTANDIGRLKEAGVRMVENESDIKAADARKKFAEAEKEFAQAEVLRHDIAIKLAEARKIQAEADAIRVKAISEAVARVADSISRIRQEGGDVSFDMGQLQSLIRRGLQAYPDEPSIQDAARQIEEGEDE